MKKGMIESVTPKNGLAKDLLSVVGGIMVAGTALIVVADKVTQKILGKKEDTKNGAK